MDAPIVPDVPFRRRPIVVPSETCADLRAMILIAEHVGIGTVTVIVVGTVIVMASQVLLDVVLVGRADDPKVLEVVTEVDVHAVACEHVVQLDVAVIVVVDGVLTEVTVPVEVDAQVLTVTVLVTGWQTVGLHVPADGLGPEEEVVDSQLKKCWLIL
jgi:hypothetical protein